MDYVQLIKQSYPGQFMTKAEIDDALHNSFFTLKHFHKDEVLHLEGEVCHCLEVLLAGDIVNLQTDQYGNELVVYQFKNTEVIAGNILFGNSPKYPLSFIAHSDGVLLQINKTFLFELFLKKPTILKHFLTIISNRSAVLGKKIKLAERKSLRELILEYLHAQRSHQNSNTIVLTLSKKEMAEHFGVQRTSVSREFSRMEKDGLIQLHDDNKTIDLFS